MRSVIRKAEAGDIEQIERIYDTARSIMRSAGNHVQWVNGYPSREQIVRDMAVGGLYVVCEATEGGGEGELLGVFYFRVEDEPTYARIDNGKWLNDKPYGVVHRMGTSGRVKGIADTCLRWCFEQCGNIRIDTHRDNAPMHHILRKHGYVECGIIYVSDGTERLAFQKCECLPTHGIN